MIRMSKSWMRVLGLGVVVVSSAGVSGCGPDETESMRQAREQREKHDMQKTELLRDARKSVRDQVRELGIKNR